MHPRSWKEKNSLLLDKDNAGPCEKNISHHRIIQAFTSNCTSPLETPWSRQPLLPEGHKGPERAHNFVNSGRIQKVTQSSTPKTPHTVNRQWRYTEPRKVIYRSKWRWKKWGQQLLGAKPSVMPGLIWSFTYFVTEPSLRINLQNIGTLGKSEWRANHNFSRQISTHPTINGMGYNSWRHQLKAPFHYSPAPRQSGMPTGKLTHEKFYYSFLSSSSFDITQNQHTIIAKAQKSTTRENRVVGSQTALLITYNAYPLSGKKLYAGAHHKQASNSDSDSWSQIYHPTHMSLFPLSLGPIQTTTTAKQFIHLATADAAASPQHPLSASGFTLSWHSTESPPRLAISGTPTRLTSLP